MSGLEDPDAVQDFSRVNAWLGRGLGPGDLRRALRYMWSGHTWCAKCGRDLSVREICRHHRHECPATWPPDATGDQLRLYCTLAHGHRPPHEAWASSNTEPSKTWRDDEELQEQR